MTQDNRLDFPATHRNADAILGVLRPLFGNVPRQVLEIASGSGQHALHLAAACPQVIWWPTDIAQRHLASIDAWRAKAEIDNIRPAEFLDVTDPAWRRGDRQAFLPHWLDAIIAINMIHIAPWAAAEGLIEGSARRLTADGFLYLYGPFKRDGEHTADSNRAFDESLHAQDPTWGVRDIADVTALGRQYGLRLDRTVAMPANNLSLVFRPDQLSPGERQSL